MARRWRLRCALWLAAGAVASRAVASWPANPATQYTFDNYGYQRGLPGTVITVATQTRDGYVWVGTALGLSRFDGVRFVSFLSLDTPGLPSDLIYCLHEDTHGVLWIGTGKGLAKFVGGQFARVGASDAAVRVLTEDRDGNILAGTTGQGILGVRNGQVEPFKADLLPNEMRVRTLKADSAGRVWIALEKDHGVLLVENGSVRRFDGGEAAFGEILAICEYPRGSLWFGTQRAGLFRLERDRLVRYGADEGISETPIFDVKPARDGGLWLAAGALLHAQTIDHPTFFSVAGLPNPNVRAVCEDREAGVWLCAGSEGLSRMREMPYRLLSTEDGLPGNNVKIVAEDRTRALWLSIQGTGVVRVGVDGAVTVNSGRDGVPGADAAVVYPARDGSIWAGASSHLWVRRNGAWAQYSDLRFIRGLYEDRQGTMWVGTESTGVFKYEQGRYTEVKSPTGGHILAATSFVETATGAIVIGTWRSGIYRVDATGTTAYDHSHGLPTDEVRAVHVDGEGRIWAGLSGRGLAVLDNGIWLDSTALTETIGSQVSAIAEDEFGRVWLGTLAGVMWARKDELLGYLRAATLEPPVHTVAVGDETRVIPVWSGGQPVLWRSADGQLLFATRRGVVAIDPAHTTLNLVPPPVHVERMFVDRKPVDPGTIVRMPAGVRSLTIDYTALSFVQPGRVLFRYRLEGYDADWVEAGTRRTAFYSSLPPGDYTFHVCACNNDGVWNTAGDRTAIVQLPYFYQTRWFYALVVLAGCAASWGIYRWSHRQLRLKLEQLERERAMENERRRIAQDLHDDLGANLTEIGLFAETARLAAPADARSELDFLAERVRTLVGSLDAIVWSVNPANDSLDQLATYVGELFQELFRAAGIRPHLDVATAIPRYPLTAEERSDLFLTAKEAMNNILKHAGATEAWLRIRMHEDELHITITDDGRGFDLATAENAGGNGLTNMKMRLARVHGTIVWQSTPGQGTKIAIAVSFAGRKENSEPV
jgi:signal transduction histidine kinase/ligand-binding sensor domain-containing protein